MSSSLSTPGPSTSQQPPKKNIFVNTDGTPIAVFVESVGVTNNRPRLVRTLRNSGAVICDNVWDAQIILVDPDTKSGRQYVRDWGSDSNKVVLDAVWGYRCIEAGRPLLKQEDWGGFGDLDGSVSSDDDDLDEIISDRLSAGKKANVKTQKSAAKRSAPIAKDPDGIDYLQSGSAKRKKLVHKNSVPNQLTKYPSSSSQSQASRRSEGKGKDTNSSTVQRLPTPSSTASSQSTSSLYSLQHALSSQPVRDEQSTAASTSRPQEVNANSVIPFDPQVAGSLASFGNLTEFTPANMQALMANPHFAAMAMGFMLQGMQQSINFPLSTQALPSSSQSTPPLAQLPFAFGHVHSPLTPQQTPDSQHTNLQINSTPQFAHFTTHSSSPSPMRSQAQRPTSPPLTLTDASRDADTGAPNSKTAKSTIPARKGGKRALKSEDKSLPDGSSSAKKRRMKLHSPTDTDKSHGRKSYIWGASALLGSTHTSSQQSSQQKSVESTPPIGIFTDIDGTPMAFFLQVEIRNRVHLISLIKKNGGKITSLPEEATYIILLKPTFSKATAKLHKEIKDLGRVALSPAFIEASIETDGLVYEPDYLAEDELLPRSLRSLSRKDMKSSQSPHRLSNTQPGTPRKLSSVDTVQSDASFISLSLDRPFEPNFVNGEPYVYSDDDKKYATEAARGFFRKHPDASLATLAQELKADHHSVSSWQNYLYNHREEFEQLKEEILFEIRVEQAMIADNDSALPPVTEYKPNELISGSVNREVSVPPIDTVLEPKPCPNSEGTSAGEKEEESAADIVGEDLNTITSYFANVTNTEVQMTDEQMWNDLEQKSKCHTATSWQEYYSAHTNEVDQMLRKALQLSEGSD